MSADSPRYLEPYMRAAARHGGVFDALLWASPRTQEARFAAAAGAIDLNGRTLLDVGCGRADFLAFLLERGVQPMHYVGLEAVPQLADAAAARQLPHCVIQRGDFVRDPVTMFVGAEIVYFSGSLNTLDSEAFHRTLRRAYDASAEMLMFNFLDSPALAASPYLYWHETADVVRFCRNLTPHVRIVDEYLPGDCTLILTKPTESA